MLDKMALLKINDFWNWLELIATIVGMIFVILEVKQKMGMWCANMLSSSMIVAISCHQMLWGTMALNIYYVVMSFVGIYQLNKDKSQTSSDIVVRPITKKVVLTSIIVFLFSSIVLVFLLKLLNDPQPILDALVMPASFIATYWLTKSYIQHWYIWIVADALMTVLFMLQGSYSVAFMYSFFLGASIVGFIHWHQKKTIIA